MTFTKIRKWANANGSEIKGDIDSTEIQITLSNGITFIIEQRESTSSRSWRGDWSGNPAGTYFRKKGERYSSADMISQKESIQRMENELN